MHEESTRRKNTVRIKSPRASHCRPAWPVMGMAGSCVDALIFITIRFYLLTFAEERIEAIKLA